VTGILSVGTISIPSFVVAIYALLLFAIELDWFPVIGAGEDGNLGDQVWHLVLPSFAVGLGWVGYLARLVRASMLEVMGENHVRTARAFGLPEPKIILHYALRIAILPTITLLALAIGGLLSSAVFAENIFARPGIGKLIVDAANLRDYPLVQGAALTTVALFAFAMPIADLIIAWLDPRVRATL
jgi:peptide/nickel transport system permease protein